MSRGTQTNRGYFGHRSLAHAFVATVGRAEIGMRLRRRQRCRPSGPGARYVPQSSDTPKGWRRAPGRPWCGDGRRAYALPFACPLVAVECIEGATKLYKFEHPERAVYLLGPEDGSLPADALRQCHRTLVIPGASHCLNVSVAASIVMYDRVSKHERGGMQVRRPLYFIDYAETATSRAQPIRVGGGDAWGCP